MNNTFEHRVHTAAVAGWRMLLVPVGFLVVQWIAYLLIMSARPAWLLFLWGADVNWQTIQNIWLWGLAFFKLCVWLLTLVVIWLTLWSRQLRKLASGQ